MDEMDELQKLIIGSQIMETKIVHLTDILDSVKNMYRDLEYQIIELSEHLTPSSRQWTEERLNAIEMQIREMKTKSKSKNKETKKYEC